MKVRKIMLVLGILAMGLILFSGCTEKSYASPSTGSKVYKIGEKFTLGDLAYTVNSIDKIDVLGNVYAYKTTEGMYYLVELTIENKGTSEKTMTPSNDFVVIDEEGRTYKPSIELAVYAKIMGFESFSAIETLQPGVPKTGIIVFEMPKKTKGKLKVKPSWFSEEAFVEFS